MKKFDAYKVYEGFCTEPGINEHEFVVLPDGEHAVDEYGSVWQVAEESDILALINDGYHPLAFKAYDDNVWFNYAEEGNIKDWIENAVKGIELEEINIDDSLSAEEEEEVSKGYFYKCDIVFNHINSACRRLEERGLKRICFDADDVTFYFGVCAEELAERAEGVRPGDIAKFLGATSVVIYQGIEDAFDCQEIYY